MTPHHVGFLDWALGQCRHTFPATGVGALLSLVPCKAARIDDLVVATDTTASTESEVTALVKTTHLWYLIQLTN